MITVDRRRFLILASTPFLMAFGRPIAWTTIEVEGASTFFAPHLEAVLSPGTLLQIIRHTSGTYLAFQGLAVATLPTLFRHVLDPTIIRVASITRDDNHRMRLFVSINRT